MASVPEELMVSDAKAWRAWLGRHHTDSAGVWLIVARKGMASPTDLAIADALDEAICHGWIDGQRRSRDEVSFLQRFTPRRPRGTWSKRNVGIVARLEAEGRMRPAGRAEVARAKADGRWDAAYSGSADMVPPDDLIAALEGHRRAKAMFEILTSQNRFAVIFRISQAKRPETRARRIAQFTDQLARGETVYPQKRTLRDNG